MHQTKMPHLVTLSRSEGSVALGREMLRGVYPECNEWAQHDSILPPAASPSCHPEPQRRVCRVGQRDASLRLSMTIFSRLSSPTSVTLSRSEGSVALGIEMLRCTQHDNTMLLPRHHHS